MPASSMKIDPGDFAIAQMVHDVQAQLAVMLGCTDNLLVGSGQADRQIAELHRCGEHATRITRAVLTATAPREVRRAVNLNEIITHASTMLSCVTGPWIRLQFRLSPEPVRVFARIFEIERILLNLVLNAREAIAADGVITIETATGSEPGARLTITDTGAGISAERGVFWGPSSSRRWPTSSQPFPSVTHSKPILPRGAARRSMKPRRH